MRSHSWWLLVSLLVAGCDGDSSAKPSVGGSCEEAGSASGIDPSTDAGDATATDSGRTSPDGSRPASPADAADGSAGGAGDGAAAAPARGRWISDGLRMGGMPDGVRGSIVLEEYTWLSGTLDGFAHLGVIQLDLEQETKVRLLDGKYPSRHPSGDIAFAQPCGTRASWIAIATPAGAIRPVTPCSSEIPNPGASPTDFGFSKLSPDRKRVAVEAFYLDDSYFSETLVYEVEGPQIARFQEHSAPSWLPDGGLLLSGPGGVYRTDPTLTTISRINEIALNARANNPQIDPTGEEIVFEYSQQLWTMGLDGSDPKRIIVGPSRLRCPTYSSDGRYLVYLQVPRDDRYDRALYFTELATMKHYAFDLDGVIARAGETTVVPMGPLSWF